MAKGYRTKLEGILKQVRPRLVSTHNLEFKNCFGAVAGYVDGRIFCSCGKFGLALRLPENQRDAGPNFKLRIETIACR